MAVSDEWVEWTRSNLKQGSAVAEVRDALKEKGFSDRDIKYALKKAVPRQEYKQRVRPAAALAGQTLLNPNIDYAALASPKLVQVAAESEVRCLCNSELQLYGIPGFLTPEQCEGLIEIIRGNAYPSRVDGYKRQSDLRSSSTCNLTVREHPNVAQLNQTISRKLGLSDKWSEVNQGQWYEPGQQYKPHPDYFPPGTPEYARFVSEQGQRTWTFMIYLNKPERGGGTHFTKIDKTIMPEQGMAVCWNNLLPSGHPNPNTEHAGLPVEAGSKFIVTKWFRDRGEGPAFVA